MTQSSRGKILIAESERDLAATLRQLLEGNYELALATSGQECLDRCADFAPDLLVLDTTLPDIDGYEICRRVKSEAGGQLTQVLLLSTGTTPADRVEAYRSGADDYLVKPFDHQELLAKLQVRMQLREAIERARTAEAKLASYSSELERLVDARTSAIEATQDVAVFALANLADSRDPETGEHLVRMRCYSQMLAEELGRHGPYTDQIDDRFLENLYRSSPLHDIGKVGISDSILLKPGPFTPEEYEVMKTHAAIGAETLRRAAHHSDSGGFLEMAASIANYHHEKWDGSGYPEGLAGQDIPLPARIVALADVFDALTSPRVYKAAFPPEKAREIIDKDSGSHFDPAVVDAFHAIYDECVTLLQGDQDEYARRALQHRCQSDWSTGLHRARMQTSGQEDVLLVCRDLDQCDSLTDWIQSAGHQLMQRDSFQGATDYMSKLCPSVVLIDWGLPDGEGLQLCRWILQERFPRPLYTVVMTREDELEEVAHALDLAADDLLTKPVRKGELLARLRVATRTIQLEKEVGRAARTDPLTGMATRGFVYEAMKREWHRACDYELPLSCALVDINGFSAINNAHGYEAGDAVISAVGKVLCDSCRTTDFSCRYGGDRFFILLPDTTEHHAAQCADRIRAAVSAMAIALGDNLIHTTVSVGVVERMNDTADLDALIELAEETLSAAKSTGPNQTVRYGLLKPPGHTSEDESPASDPFHNAQAAELMHTPVESLAENVTAEAAARFLLERGINSAPVVDEQGQLVGVLSERDVMAKLVSLEQRGEPIRSVMSANVVSFEEDTPAREIYEFLCRAAIRRVFVVRGGKPTGIISRDTLLRWLTDPSTTEVISRRSTTEFAESEELVEDIASLATELAEEVHDQVADDDSQIDTIPVDSRQPTTSGD